MNKKMVAMIPVRLGSKRIPKKNLRLLDGKPLIAYIIESAISSNIFDNIYINSEANIFKEIADSYKIKFYNRPQILSSDSATNDEFALDFINNVECDILIQLLSTSPFLTPNDIRFFVKRMLDEQYETLISVKNEQIECIYDGKPINFVQKDKTLPSQMLRPVQPYTCGIMGWDVKRFQDNMRKFGAAYHGGEGTIGFYILKGFSTNDIDIEEDFRLAEAIIRMQKSKMRPAEFYIAEKERNIHSEVDVHMILKKDGVEHIELFENINIPLSNIDKIINGMPQGISWSQRIINTASNSATLVCQLPGEGNRLHYHKDWNEWWYIVDGEWEWEIEDEKIIVKKGDVVFIEKGKMHKITAIGEKAAIRLAVSREDVAHIYPQI